jgi:hypothetical protein
MSENVDGWQIKPPRKKGGFWTVTVCSACLRASCWQGYFHCDDYRQANTLQKSSFELKKLKLENPEFWKEDQPNA